MYINPNLINEALENCEDIQIKKENLYNKLKEINEEIELSKNILEYQRGILEGFRIALQIIKEK